MILERHREAVGKYCGGGGAGKNNSKEEVVGKNPNSTRRAQEAVGTQAKRVAVIIEPV